MEDNNESLRHLGNVNFMNPSDCLDSPRSLKICKKMGVDPESLYYYDIEEYRKKNPEVRFLSKEIQTMRFNHLHKLREQMILKLKEERKKLINDNIDNADLDSKSISKNKSKASSQPNIFKSTAIENELKMIEKIKEKQKQEIQNLIENEMRSEIIRQENEEKLKDKKEKEEEYKKNLLKKNKEKEREQKRKEELREMQMKMELEEQKKKDQEKFMEEQKKLKEDELKEKQRKKELMQREEEQKRKQEEFRAQTERLLLEEQKKAEEKQKILEEKEKQRLEYLEKKRLEKIRESEKQKEYHDQRILITRQKMEEKMIEQKGDFLKKQKMNEEKRRQFEELREVAIKKQKEESLKKQEDIQRVLEKNKELEQMKLDEYNKKQEEIQKQKRILEKVKEEQKLKQVEEQRIREIKILETRQRNELIGKERASTVLTKINSTDRKIRRLKQSKEKDLMFKNEMNTLKRTEKAMNIERIEKMKEYEKEKAMEKIQDNYRKAEEFKLQKSLVMSKKLQAVNEINKKKEEVMKMFDSIMKRNKALTPEVVKELFPDDEDLYERLVNTRMELMNKSKNRSKSIQPSPNEGIKKKNMEPSASISQILNKKKISNGSNRENDSSCKISTPHNHLNSLTNNNEHIPKSKSKPKVNLYKQPEKKDQQSVVTSNQPLEENKKDHSLPPLSSESQSASSNRLSILKLQKKILTEKEIQKKIEEYKKKLISDLLKVLSDEKYKEEERELTYNKTTNPVEKKRLEKVIAMERAQSSEKIMKINEQIDLKLRDYEQKLRKNNS